MKRNFTRILAAFALLVGLTIPMGMWGQSTYTKVTTAPSDWSGTYVIVADESNVIFTGQSGTNNYGGYAAVTISNNSVTGDFTAYEVEIEQSGENYSIKHITSTKYLGLTSDGNNLNFSTQAPADNKYRWILSTNEIVPASYSETRRLQYNSASSGLRFACYKKTQKDAFLYKKEAGSTTTCATPTFNPAAGTYTEAQNVTISCATEGATIYYTTNGDNPTTSSAVYSSPITISETTTLKAMAAATGYSNSAMASATYTITTPSTIAEVRAQGTGNVFTQGIVTSCVGTTGYIQDNTAAICVYGNSLNVGDEIRVSGTLTTYHGLLEITDPQITVLSNGNTVSPTPKTIAEINADDYTLPTSIQGLYVTIEEATVTAINGQNTTIAQGENTIVVRGIYSNVSYNVNDVLTLDGNIGCYDAAQIANPQNVTVQANTDPVINVTNSSIELAYNATSGEIGYTISNPVDGQNLNATTTADWISNINVGSESVTFTTTANEGDADRSATITLSYTGATDKEITVTQGHYVVDYATLPFAFNNGKNAIEETNGLTQSGLGSDYADENTKLKFDSTDDFVILKINERPGILTFYIKGNSFSGGTFKVQTSADGVSYSDLETYTTFGNNETYEEEFDNLNENVRYIKWIYTNKVSGNVGLGNITLGEYVAPQPSITVESNVINVDAESHQEFLNVNFVNFEPTTGYAFTCDANGTFTDYSWLVAELDINNSRVRYTIGNNEEVARTGYFRVKCGDVYSEIVTVNQAAYVPPFEPATYIPATEINPDKRYIIVGFIGDDAYAMGYQKTNNRHAVGISFDGTTATVETSEVYELVIANQGNYYTIYDERTPGFLYAASDEKNWLRTEEELDDDGNGLWNITFGEQGLVDLVAVNTNVRNVMQFNAGSSTTDPLFACYASANQEPVYLYEKVESAEYTLEITGYTDDNVKDGYHLIASPVFVDPYLVGMADGDFDLYSFDQSEDEEWRNYEAGSFTMLEPGKGYLYAKKATDNVQTYYFNLSGTPYVGDGYIDLAYDANEGVSFPGLNLIGNPFGEEATLNIPYYRMNSTGSGLEAVNETESPVNVMEGVFVYAEYNSEYGYVTNYAQFTPNGNTSGGGGMKINLSRNRGTAIDNAIVRFDEGQQLPKFQLFENSTKLYIPQGNEDYAIVRSAAQGEMPVSFRASENGTYTIAVEAENVDMNYLHLIDNMTGADVDLLATPNYTFEARTNDYTSRFRLVFSANGIDEQTAETFAYFNGTNWTVSNTGDATLQVVDITGRIVSSETINGNATISINQPAGIYMLRLVNGNDVKVQKVVVR